jgi:hypothetical protein
MDLNSYLHPEHENPARFWIASLCVHWEDYDEIIADIVTVSDFNTGEAR